MDTPASKPFAGLGQLRRALPNTGNPEIAGDGALGQGSDMLAATGKELAKGDAKVETASAAIARQGSDAVKAVAGSAPAGGTFGHSEFAGSFGLDTSVFGPASDHETIAGLRATGYGSDLAVLDHTVFADASSVVAASMQIDQAALMTVGAAIKPSVLELSPSEAEFRIG